MAESARKPRRKKKTAAEPGSRGIPPDSIGAGTPPAALTELAQSIQADGGTVLAPYKDPLGGHWQIFAALPIDLVEPTPYQRDLSKPHVERLSEAMDKLGRFLDPMIVVRREEVGKVGNKMLRFVLTGHLTGTTASPRSAGWAPSLSSPSWCLTSRSPTGFCCSIPRRHTT